MTEDDPAETPVRQAPIDRPHRARADPAEMRETLDAARRRLGPDESGASAPSAEHQRALLREAAANHAAPLAPSTARPPTDPNDDRPDERATVADP